MTVINRSSVEERLASALAALEAPIEVDASSIVHDAEEDMCQVYDLATESVAFGYLSLPRGKGYGFLDDVFIPPYLIEANRDILNEEKIFSVHCRPGPKSRVATGIVPLAKYFEWHPEVLEKLKAERIEDIKKSRMREVKDLELALSSFERKVELVKEFGTLVEVRKEYRNNGYGARGVDEYVFAEAIRFPSDAEAIVDALHGRHEDGCDGGYFHGRDVITLVEDGHTVKNSWMGPYTD